MHHRRTRPRRSKTKERGRWGGLRIRPEDDGRFERPAVVLESWRDAVEEENRERNFDDTWDGFTDEDFAETTKMFRLIKGLVA